MQPQQQVLYNPTVQPVGQQPTQPGSNATGQRLGFAHDSAKRCGVIQIICGFSMLITNIILIVVNGFANFIGYGIWGAIFLFISGGLGVQASKSKNTCPIVGTLIMSIFSCLVGFIVFIFACIGLGIDLSGYYCNEHWDEREDRHICYNFMVKPEEEEIGTRLAMHGLNIIIGLIALIVPIVQSCISCRAVCCPPKGQLQGAVIYTAQPVAQYPVQGSAVNYPQQPGQPYTNTAPGYPPPQASYALPPGQYPQMAQNQYPQMTPVGAVGQYPQQVPPGQYPQQTYTGQQPVPYPQVYPQLGVGQTEAHPPYNPTFSEPAQPPSYEQSLHNLPTKPQ